MGATAHVEVSASHGDRMVVVLVDLDDYLRIDGRALSVGSHGYVQMWIRPRVVLLHRWLLDLPVGDRRRIGDHRSRDPFDCRQRNLRVVDPSVSNANRSPSDSRFAGVERARSGNWQARPQWRRARHYLGTYPTREAAALAVQQWRDRVPESRSPHATGVET